jgi:ATP-binding cassette subfamily C (CFTR/MRP) protein 1
MALPRICLIGFNYAQPFLISSVIINVSNRNSDPSDKNNGYGLIAATGLIYLGITVGVFPLIIFNAVNTP